jgi:hypothetical protein
VRRLHRRRGWVLPGIPPTDRVYRVFIPPQGACSPVASLAACRRLVRAAWLRSTMNACFYISVYASCSRTDTLCLTYNIFIKEDDSLISFSCVWLKTFFLKCIRNSTMSNNDKYLYICKIETYKISLCDLFTSNYYKHALNNRQVSASVKLDELDGLWLHRHLGFKPLPRFYVLLGAPPNDPIKSELGFGCALRLACTSPNVNMILIFAIVHPIA